jgi:hypothetical protein
VGAIAGTSIAMHRPPSPQVCPRSAHSAASVHCCGGTPVHPVDSPAHCWLKKMGTRCVTPTMNVTLRTAGIRSSAIPRHAGATSSATTVTRSSTCPVRGSSPKLAGSSVPPSTGNTRWSSPASALALAAP